VLLLQQVWGLASPTLQQRQLLGELLLLLLPG
jgi:hypothetical protein